MNTTVLQSVVMAGGFGTLLWPLSRPSVGEAINASGIFTGENDNLRFEDIYGRA